MKSYLISALAFRFNSADAEAFRKHHPHDWPLWDPGARRPPTKTALLAPQGESSPPRGGEALALALQPKKDSTQVTLGRGEECDITINDGTLSQLHLVFMHDPKADT